MPSISYSLFPTLSLMFQPLGLLWRGVPVWHSTGVPLPFLLSLWPWSPHEDRQDHGQSVHQEGWPTQVPWQRPVVPYHACGRRLRSPGIVSWLGLDVIHWDLEVLWHIVDRLHSLSNLWLCFVCSKIKLPSKQGKVHVEVKLLLVETMNDGYPQHMVAVKYVMLYCLPLLNVFEMRHDKEYEKIWQFFTTFWRDRLFCHDSLS